ncbi:nucleoid-associated protein [Vibrio parahaemolyticus]|nr:nucleoid-associated protein [Vibrio parahaemolyticus]
MQLINLQIKRIAIHQIYQRDQDGNKITPTKGSELIKFAPTAMTTFKERVIRALGVESRAVPMQILDQTDTAIPSIISTMKGISDNDFIEQSYIIANKLADAQTSRALSGGVVVVFEGTYGASAKELVGIMKAEIHSAYEKKVDPNTLEISLDYVEEALLTPATKLYKTAGFFRNTTPDEETNLNKKWDVSISDTQISKTDGKAAAHYFYSVFLGCGYPDSSARTTKHYYDATSAFINDLDVTAEKRNDLHNALVTFLKHENTEIVNPTEFANRYFTEEQKDSYTHFLEEKDLPTTSFTKDIEHISNKLKHRKLSFSQNVKLVAPSEVFKELVHIESILEDDTGNSVNWTKLIIKDQIVSQE